MNRAENRANIRKNQKFTKEMKKLTPNQLKLIDAMARTRTDKLISVYEELVDKAVFKSMRENHVSENRTNKIMEEANEWILDEMKSQ